MVNLGRPDIAGWVEQLHPSASLNYLSYTVPLRYHDMIDQIPHIEHLRRQRVRNGEFQTAAGTMMFTHTPVARLRYWPRRNTSPAGTASWPWLTLKDTGRARPEVHRAGLRVR